MKKSLVVCIGILLFLLSNRALGQAGNADSSAVNAAVSGLRQRYTAAVGRAESRLYNGPEYVSQVEAYLNGHPFFESAQAQNATITYGGATYVGVPLRYDLMLDLLVINAPRGDLDMQLINEKVTGFTVNNHSFIRLVADSVSGSPIRTGFYELLVDGPVQVLTARKKSKQKRSTAQGMVGEITQKNEFFIYKDRRYSPANSARQVLALFPEHKAALRKFVRTEKLKFREASRETDLIDLVRYQATLPAPAVRPN